MTEPVLNPEEQEYIQGLVNRSSFTVQAAKAVPLRNTMRAVDAIQGRVRWSEKLLDDHRIIAAVERLMRQLGSAATRPPILSVAKALPFVGIGVGAAANSVVLGGMAADAKRFCQTRFLCCAGTSRDGGPTGYSPDRTASGRTEPTDGTPEN